MAIVRTFAWVLLLVGLILFSLANWQPQISVRIWSNLVVDTRLPAVVVISFLLGFLPLWLYHRGVVWSLKRRIGHLENVAAQPQGAAPRTDGEPGKMAGGPATPPASAADDPLRPARPTDGLSPADRP